MVYINGTEYIIIIGEEFLLRHKDINRGLEQINMDMDPDCNCNWNNLISFEGN